MHMKPVRKKDVYLSSSSRWNFVVTLVPLWVAPNLITMVGLVINVVTSVILMWMCPTATEPVRFLNEILFQKAKKFKCASFFLAQAPAWPTFACALGLFAYQTLDAIDGKQARRTGSQSPLGELFDHGCDSLSTVFVTMATACAVSLGHNPGFLLLQCLSAPILFYCAHWQAYVTGERNTRVLKNAIMDLTHFASPRDDALRPYRRDRGSDDRHHRHDAHRGSGAVLLGY